MILLAALLLGQAVGSTQTIPSEFEAQRRPTFTTGGNVLIRNGRVLTITRGFLDGADVLVTNGKIAQVGKGLVAPAGVKVIDASGKFVTPGLVDAHSHRGADDINEGADSITAEVRIEDVLNPNQLSLYYALASGITTGMLLHGSANPIGGQSLVIKHKWMRPPNEVAFPGAPRMIKFALGENPKRPGQTGDRFPSTRLGVEAVYRRAFADARDYIRRWAEYDARRGEAHLAPPRRDLRMETLAGILQGKIRVQCHSYRQDEILMMVRLSQEFGFNLTLQHALEAYKIAPELRAAHIPVSVFGDGFAYKLEVIDSMPMASSILDKAGVLVSVNTDTFGGLPPLTQDAAKAMRYGTSPDHALRMVTINPAIELGIDKKVGSIEVGKDGDLALWDGHPLSSYTKCVMTFIEGEPYFERRDMFKVDGRSMAAPSVEAKPFDLDANKLPATSRSYIIVGATVHPVSGPDLTDAAVLIVDGVIREVGKSVRGGSGAVRVDGHGLHVWPGMIDAASQLGLAEIGEVPSASDLQENGDYQPDLRAVTSINPDSIHFPKVRYNGVTSAMVYPTAGAIAGLDGVVETAGMTTEGMTVERQVGLDVFVPAGFPEQFKQFMPADQFAKALAASKDKRRRLREYLEAAKRFLDARKVGGDFPTDIKFNALAQYFDGNKPVLFHCGDEDTIRYALSLIKEFKFKGVLVGASDAWKVAKELKSLDVAVIATPPAGACPDEDVPAEFDPYDTPLAFGSVLQDAGVRFAFGSQAWDMAMNLPYRVGRMCAFGLSHTAAMRALTLDAAKILQVDDRLGSLEPGKIANVIITDGDPLEVTTHLRYLFIAGKPVALESRFTDLYRKYSVR